MAVTAADLQAPKGVIEPESMFPGLDAVALNDRLTQYIADGVTRVGAILTGTDADDAVKLYAYHRAYLAVYIRLSASPNSATLTDQASYAFSSAQIKAFGDLAQRYLADFEALILVPQEQQFPPGNTVAVETQYSW